jgi:hypothetical protein
VAPVQRGLPVERRIRSAAELPTRRQIRHCVLAKASLRIFSQLPSAWRSYDSGDLRGIVSTDRPLEGEYAYTRRPVTYRMASQGAGSPTNQIASPTMISALNDGGIGVDGGHSANRRHTAARDLNVTRVQCKSSGP